MPIQRPKYHVVYKDATQPHRQVDHAFEADVEVSYGDQLRAEFEANKQGLPRLSEAPQNHTAVWLWCALVRMGLYGGTGLQFRLEDLLDVVGLDEDEEAAEVPPTPPAPSGSGSSSPTTSAEAPPTGSTPTSTTG